MIVFDLECRACAGSGSGNRFEGWFGSSGDYAAQVERGLVTCPVCGSADVGKAVMAPAVGRKGNQPAATASPPTGTELAAPAPVQPVTTGSLPPEAVAMLRTLAKMQAEVLKSSTWVGAKFADDARAMHYGEKDAALIHGQATAREAQELADEGIGIAPVLFPMAPPGELN